MALNLHVISYENHAPISDLSLTVNEGRCTIGRDASNDFALPDVERIISHLHASIQFENGDYYLTDNSTNGVYINHAPEPVGQGNRALLHTGDILTIGKYDCAISITAQQKPVENSLLDKAMWQPPLHPELDGKKPNLVNSPYPEPALPIPQSSSQGPGPAAEQDYFSPPEAIRDDWDELTGLKSAIKTDTPQIIPEPVTPESIPEPVTPQVIPEPVKPQKIPEPAMKVQTPPPHARPATHKKKVAKPVAKQHKDTQASATLNQQAVDAFLAGAGMEQVQLDPEEFISFMNTAGKSLHELTQGFKQVLNTRTSLKNEFRLGMTTFQPAENNPLKLSIDVEDALNKLLLPQQKGYLPPVEAIQEATDDLQAHQMALLAGLRAALSSLVALFDPEVLEKDLQNASIVDNLLPLVRKAKYWELFKTSYREASADAENDFLHFLGDEFSTAYEQQIQRLRSIRQKNNQ